MERRLPKFSLLRSSSQVAVTATISGFMFSTCSLNCSLKSIALSLDSRRETELICEEKETQLHKEKGMRILA